MFCYTYRSVSYSATITEVPSCRLWEKDSEAQMDKMQRLRGMEHSAKQDFSTESLLQGSRNTTEQEEWWFGVPEVMGDTKELMSSRHINSLRVAACKRPAKFWTWWGHRTESKSGHKPLSLTSKLSQLITAHKKKISFLQGYLIEHQ